MSMSSINWSSPPPTYDASYTTTTLTPYLQLSHLLSLTWLAYPIISLVFIAFRLQLSLSDAQDAVIRAKADLLTSCKAAETAATSAASMPRYMALATNKQYVDAVNASLNAARAALVLSLTVMEAIINFIIDIYRSTFFCFLELVVRGGLAILIGAVQEINNVLQTVAGSLRTGIQNDISAANSVISTAINTINKVNPFGNITPPQITVPSLDSLQNVTLPASFQDALTRLNASLPSVNVLKDAVESVIDTPFELLKKDINDTFANITFSPDGLPVPELTRLSFCNDLDTSVIDDIGHDFVKIAKIGILVIILLALLLIGLNCLLTWYKWHSMKKHLQYTREAWMTDPTMVHLKPSSASPQITMSDHNLLILQASSQHPLITRVTNRISARFRLTPAQHTHMQWFFHYIFHTPALACFLIGFFGLLSVQVQLAIMGPLLAKSQNRATSAVTDFSTTIASSINDSMYNQSSLYANAVNGQVDSIQLTINDGVLGWVNGTTTTLNDTINLFYSDIQNAVSTVFNGTILESTVSEFLRCFLGSKVDAIENALTFLHDNLRVDIPRLNQTVLILSPEAVNEASQPIAEAAIGGGNGDKQGLIGQLVNSYAQSLKKERLMFGIFMIIWGVVILMALVIIFWHSYGHPYLEKRRKRKWEAEQRVGIDGISVYPGVAGGLGDEKQKEFNSFSPLPSPRASVLKPFWSSRSNSPITPQDPSPASSQESIVSPNDPAFFRPLRLPSHDDKKKPTKLLAIGRKAIRRERLKRDGTEEEYSAPLSPIVVGEPVSTNNRNTTWYTKMAALLARKDTDREANESSSDSDFWVHSAMPMASGDKLRPKLEIYTQKGLDKYGPPVAKPGRGEQHLEGPPRSHWSTSPKAAQTSWGKIMSPTNIANTSQPAVPVAPTPIVVISQEPDTPTRPYYSPNFPHPPIGIPIRPRQQAASIPHDVGDNYEDSTSVKPAIIPLPLYSGFDSPHRYPSHPPRHQQLQVAGWHQQQRQDDSPPPPTKSPRMYQPQLALTPPPLSHLSSDRHRKGTSTGTTWRVTNAVPGDNASLSSASLASLPTQSRDDQQQPPTPVTRLMTTVHARQSSSVNPFITPFDDEHRVRINYPTGAGTRKSIPTNPFVHAI